MIPFVIRCLITFALLDCVQYSTSFTHADVRDPHPCLSLIGGARALSDGTCIYHDVTLHGDPFARRFWIGKQGSVQVESRDAAIQFSPGDQSGWTWRTYLLLLGAALPWTLSLLDVLSRLAGRKSQVHARCD